MHVEWITDETAVQGESSSLRAEFQIPFKNPEKTPELSTDRPYR